jgi:RNA 3'-terminal phosphate cyclase (ATP)
VARLIGLEAGRGESEGQVLRAGLALACATGQGFEMVRIGPGKLRPGLRAAHLGILRTAALLTRARVGGAFEGSPDVRFEPGPLEAGEYRAELGANEAAPLLLEALLPPLASLSEGSSLEVSGGTHLPSSPSYEYICRHWAAAVAPLGFRQSFELVRAGFGPSGSGEVRGSVLPRTGTADPFLLERRGALLSVSGVSGGGRLKGQERERQRAAAHERLWEARRIEAAWTLVDVPAASPGAFLLLEAVFENGRAAFGFLGKRLGRPEVLGDRAARELLRFLESEGAVDPPLADQLAVPLALARRGGRVSTSEVTPHMLSVARVLSSFGVPARTWGRPGGPGGLEVDRC